MKHVRAGFTLIELMVVIALLGILTMIAAPSFSDYLDSSQLQFSQQILETTLGQAFSHARSNPESVSVSGVTDGRSIMIITNNDTNNAVSQALDRGIRFDTDFTITFTPPYGDIAETGPETEIQLNGRRYHSITLVHHISGLIETLSSKTETIHE